MRRLDLATIAFVGLGTCLGLVWCLVPLVGEPAIADSVRAVGCGSLVIVATYLQYVYRRGRSPSLAFMFAIPPLGVAGFVAHYALASGIAVEPVSSIFMFGIGSFYGSILFPLTFAHAGTLMFLDSELRVPRPNAATVVSVWSLAAMAVTSPLWLPVRDWRTHWRDATPVERARMASTAAGSIPLGSRYSELTAAFGSPELTNPEQAYEGNFVAYFGSASQGIPGFVREPAIEVQVRQGRVTSVRAVPDAWHGSRD